MPSDVQALDALAGARRGATAYVGARPPASGADLVLLAGAAPAAAAADALELDDAADRRRGRLCTLFRADSWAFLQRPSPPAVGLDLSRGQGSFARLSPGAEPHDVMIALALHLGCAAVMLDEELRDGPGFHARMESLGLPASQILWQARARSARSARA
jgi:hypothetical protein